MERLWWNGSRIVPEGLASFNGIVYYLLSIQELNSYWRATFSEVLNDW
ncbi:hypothetical protein [Paenibacillus sp. FSL H8-0034]